MNTHDSLVKDVVEAIITLNEGISEVERDRDSTKFQLTGAAIGCAEAR